MSKGSIKGIEQVQSLTQRFRRRGDAFPGEALNYAKNELSETILNGIRENFETEGHGKWERLRPSTIEIRRGLGYKPGPILVREGELKGWATGGGNPPKVRGTSKRVTLSFGVPNVPKAVHNQEGLGVVARPFMYLSDQTRRNRERSTGRFLLDIISKKY